MSAHRVALHVSSPFFRVLFASPPTGGKDADGRPIFIIEQVNGDTLALLVEFCYSGKIAIDHGNVHAIHGAAVLLQLDELPKRCAKYVMDSLAPTNCLGIWRDERNQGLENVADTDRTFEMALQQLGNVVKEEELKTVPELAFEMALWHFKKVVQGNEFIHMDLGALVTFLSRDDINAHSEEEIFEAMMKWIWFDEVNRKSSFPVLVKAVRLNHLKESVSFSLHSSGVRSSVNIFPQLVFE